MSTPTEATIILPGAISSAAGAERPRHASAIAATLTFARRGLLRLRHTPEQLFHVVTIPAVFTVMFTYLFGGALDGSTGHYLQFLLPGTVVISVLFVTSDVAVQLNTDIGKGVYDRYRTLPTWRPAPLVGALLGQAGHFLLSATLVIALGLAMGFRPGNGPLGAVAAVALLLAFALSLTWAWMALGLFLRTPASVSGITSAFMLPFTFASNVFARPHTMPAWLRDFIDINPVAHLVTAERGLIDGTATSGQIAWVLIASAILTVVFAPAALYLFNRRSS